MRNDIIFFDLETGSLDTQTCEILEIAAVAIDGRDMSVRPQTFSSLCKPEVVDKDGNFPNIGQEALRITGIKVEDLQEAPPLKVVFSQFINFLKKHNWENNWQTKPIIAGFNILGFDIPIIERVARKLKCGIDKEGRIDVINRIYRYDLLQLCHQWLNSKADLINFKQDTVCDYFGVPRNGSHRALIDCENGALILRELLSWMKHLSRKTEFKNSLKDKNECLQSK